KQKLLTDFDTQLNKINHQEQELQTKLAVIKNNHANESNQNSYLKESISQATEQISELQGKLNDLDSEKNQLDLSNTEVKNRIKECQTEINDLQDVVAKLKAEREKQQALSSELNSKAQRNFDLQKAAADQQESLAIQNTKLSNQIDSRLDTLSQDYQLTYEASLQELKRGDYDPEALKKEARLLKMGIEELGTVNLSAIDDYDKVKDRYEFLTQQQNDLLQARSQLLDTMSEMDKEVTTRFKKTFDEVSEAFEKIFTEMFAG